MLLLSKHGLLAQPMLTGKKDGESSGQNKICYEMPGWSRRQTLGEQGQKEGKENKIRYWQEHRPSFQVISTPMLSTAILAFQYQVNC